MTFANISWWLAVLCVGVALEWVIPGTDFLLPAFMLALQEGNRTQCALMLLAIVLLQEGLGSLDFGGLLIWYLIVIFAYSTARRAIGIHAIFFKCLIGLVAGAGHFAVITLMCLLQDMTFDAMVLLGDSAFQATTLPILWPLAETLRWGKLDDNPHQL